MMLRDKILHFLMFRHGDGEANGHSLLDVVNTGKGPNRGCWLGGDTPNPRLQEWQLLR
jgi:hypothetical protein